MNQCNMIEEKIICAANWYPELSLIYDEFPSSHLRPTNVNKGIVFCGHLHLQCMYQMIAMTGKKQHESGGEISGFLTNLNRFVDRTEGAKIALETGQIEKLKFGRILYSEDLY